MKVKDLKRRSGRTTRIVDQAIQELFMKGSAILVDNIDSEVQSRMVARRVENRLKSEHKACNYVIEQTEDGYCQVKLIPKISHSPFLEALMQVRGLSFGSKTFNSNLDSHHINTLEHLVDRIPHFTKAIDLSWAERDAIVYLLNKLKKDIDK